MRFMTLWDKSEKVTCQDQGRVTLQLILDLRQKQMLPVSAKFFKVFPTKRTKYLYEAWAF
jgi:hypothetical protein